MTPRLTISLLLLVLASMPLDAQRRRRGPRWVEPVPSWGLEASLRASILKDDAVTYVGARVGRQLTSAFNLGVGGSMMLTNSAESLTADAVDRVTSLVYLGPSIELRDSLRGPVRFLFRTTAAAGLVGFEESSGSAHRDALSLLLGLEQEAGINVRITRALQMSATVGALFAWRVDGGREIVSGPTASFGLRLVR